MGVFQLWLKANFPLNTCKIENFIRHKLNWPATVIRIKKVFFGRFFPDMYLLYDYPRMYC